MSGAARTLGPSRRSTWVRRHARLAVIATGIIGTGAAVMIFGQERQPDPVEAPKSAALVPTTYEAPKDPAIVAVVAKPPAPVVDPTPAIAKTDTSAAGPVAAKLEVMSFRRSTGQLPPYMQPKPAAAAQAGDPTASGIAYKGEALEGGSAFYLKNHALVLPAWTTIPCILDTAVITGVSGLNPFKCHLPEDVTSDDGIPLMEAGTKVGGFYQNLVAEGQTRIVSVTADAKTPHNVVVKLGGPVADQIGAAGVEGTVENHWGPRLLGGLILSLFDAGVALGSSALQSGNGNQSINIGGGLRGGPFSQAAESLLQKQLNIPPTISLKQGTKVMLWTTRYTTFEHVYALESRR